MSADNHMRNVYEEALEHLRLAEAMYFLDRYGMTPTKRIAIHPETLARCESAEKASRYIRWYLKELAKQIDNMEWQ